MTTIFGPRIFVKRDAESSIGRGCEMYAAHWRPELAIIPRIAAATAPHSTREVWLTEGFRNIRDTRDRHEDLCAFDITFVLDGAAPPTIVQYGMVRERMCIFLGPDYDIPDADHGSAPHIHCEYDPKVR